MKPNKSLLVIGVLLIGAALFSNALFAHAENDKNDKEDIRSAAAASKPEMHVSAAGKVQVNGAKVLSIGSDSITVAVSWGSFSFNWTVRVNSDTEFIRRFGGKSSLSEISVGDFINFRGNLARDASSATVQATSIRDWSIQKRQANFAGSVKSIDANAKTFILASNDRGDITVIVSSSAQIAKSSAASSFADLAVGAKVTASGLWDTVANTLQADKIQIRVPAQEEKTTVEGTIKAVVSTTLPTTLVVRVKDIDRKFFKNGTDC